MSVRERLLIRRLRERDERAFREMVDDYVVDNVLLPLQQAIAIK